MKDNFVRLIPISALLFITGCSNPIIIKSKVVKYSEAKKIRTYVLENRPDFYASEENKFFIFSECAEEAAPNKCDFVLSVAARDWGCTTWFDVKRINDEQYEFNKNESTVCR